MVNCCINRKIISSILNDTIVKNIVQIRRIMSDHAITLDSFSHEILMTIR